MENKKICLIASSGGHFEQLLMLKSLANNNNVFIITEKTRYNYNVSDIPIYYLQQTNRKEKKFIINFLENFVLSFRYFYRERPDVVISTGVLSTIPMCLIAKIFRKKIVYIESFAKITTPTLTGKFMYLLSDLFYVQWESMLKVYPKAKFIGVIY